MINFKESILMLGRRGLAVFFMFLTSAAMLWAQDVNEKFSMTTQMFLNSLTSSPSAPSSDLSPVQGRLSRRKLPSLWNGPVAEAGMMRPDRRASQIVAPDTVAGIPYISCFIHLKDAKNLSQVRSLGVQIEETFDGQDFVTARVPVAELENLAGIDNVTLIKVARRMRPLTDVARQQTNTDDLLTLSSDAVGAGVNTLFDGTGVVLGIIDTGIDFQHIAFKDKDGNSRIKRAYVYNGTSSREYSTITSTSPTTDNNCEDHGTHTASAAGGSSVKVSGTAVSVTDDHADATFGGMAPGADLYLAGINDLNDASIVTALKKMVSYADSQGKPLVVSNSWGSNWGSHDGKSELADLVAQYFGHKHPNHIILFASSNDAGRSVAGEGGGFFVKGNAVSSSNPLGTIVRSPIYSDADCGYGYMGMLALATSQSKMNCKLHVLNNSTGAVLKSWTITNNTSSFSGLSTYYSGSMQASMTYENGSYILAFITDENGLQAKAYSGTNYTKSKYTLAIEVYPASGTDTVNMWSGDYTYFSNHLTTSDHTWTAGTDDMCVSDEATIPDAISVGAHVSKKRWRAYNGSYYTSNEYTVGDIAYFSSYATAELSLTGEAYPCITAPGARIAAGVNHYHTSSVDRDYSYYGGLSTDLVVNSSSSPYGMMEGTSMSTPVAAGIVALWMQAAQSVGMDLTVHDVKDIMQQTAIHDAYTTTGANASHFGNGKIDALAGIQYILSLSEKPTILASKASINFTANYEPELCKTETFTVRGSNLEADISVALDDPSGNFSVSTQSIPMATAADGTDIIVTWTPTTIGETAATLTLSSNGVNDVVISLTGKLSAIQTYSLVTDASTLEDGDKVIVAGFDGDDCYVLGNSQRTNNREATNDVTINADGTLIPGETAQVITLEKEGSDFLLYVGDGYLYAPSSGSNYLRTETAPDDNGNAKAAISISNGDATIRFQGTSTRNLLGFNKVNNPKIFSCYGGTSANVLLPRIYRESPIALNNEGRSNTGTIAAYSGKTVNISLLGRTFFKDGSWNTLCLPFDAPIAGGPLEGADVRALYSASLVDDTLTLNFTEAGVVSAIDAGTPYIMKWTNGDNIVNPVFKNVTVTPDVNEFVSNDDKVRFVGTYDFISFDDEDRNILFMGETNTLNYPLAGARIGACHSYFLLDDDSQVKEFVLTFDGDPDGIREIKDGKLKAEEEDVIYNLAGQRVKGQGSRINGQLPRGIYIVGGKKIYVK